MKNFRFQVSHLLNFFLFVKIVAERHFFRTILTRTFSLWRQLIEEKHHEERAERLAIEFYYQSLQRQVLTGWKLVR